MKTVILLALIIGVAYLFLGPWAFLILLASWWDYEQIPTQPVD